MIFPVKEAAPDARIIFVTGYDQYALEAYRVHAQGYLMKPVDAAAILEELDLIPHAPKPQAQTLYVQCFGFFDVFWQGEPLLFKRRKTKELLAFLVDRKGVACTAEEIAGSIHPHPSLSEMMGEAALAVDGKPIHF